MESIRWYWLSCWLRAGTIWQIRANSDCGDFNDICPDTLLLNQNRCVPHENVLLSSNTWVMWTQSQQYVFRILQAKWNSNLLTESSGTESLKQSGADFRVICVTQSVWKSSHKTPGATEWLSVSGVELLWATEWFVHSELSRYEGSKEEVKVKQETRAVAFLPPTERIQPSPWCICTNSLFFAGSYVALAETGR